MMIELIARLAGRGLGDEVSQHLLLQSRRGGDRQQTGNVTGGIKDTRDPVDRARQIMASSIDEPRSCAAIARTVGVSERHLQRLFRDRLGTGMAQVYQSIRMERAHQLIQLTDLTITQVAVACGFGSLEVFSRTYKKTFGVAPSRDRRQSVDSSVYRIAPLGTTRAAPI